MFGRGGSAEVGNHNPLLTRTVTEMVTVTITIHISATLRAYCKEDTSELVCSAETVRLALQQLEQIRPLVYKAACDETGAIRRHVHFFVNDTFIHDREGLDTPLAPGDVLSIMPAVSGG